MANIVRNLVESNVLLLAQANSSEETRSKKFIALER